MSPTENPEGLLATTRQLVRQVETLDRHLRVHEGQARRTRFLTIVASILAVLSLAGATMSVSLYRQVHEAEQANQHNAVTGCENANESRKANLALWEFVLSASAANNPNPTPREKKLRKNFQSWVENLFAAHDCSDLSRQYPVPPPPPVS